MIEVVEGALAYSNLLILLTIGLTVTYITTGVPNFAQGSFAVAGSYLALTLLQLFNVHPYAAIPISFLFGGALGLLVYFIVLKPLIKREATPVMLMIATLALDLILLGVLGAYAECLRSLTHKPTTKFIFTPLDFRIGSVTGVLFVSTTVMASLILSMYILLYKTRFGVEMRASMENPSLAEVLGVNVELMRVFSWFLSASLGAVAGCLLPFQQEIVPTSGALIIVSIFAASIVGGMSNVWGALLGGYLIGISESLVAYMMSTFLGPWILFFGKVIAFTFLVVVLIVSPEGLLELIRRGG